MSWLLWIVVAWFIIGALATISEIGKPRKPMQPAVGVLTVIFATIMIVLTIIGGGLLA